MLLIDLDDFKQINDSFGHPVGDEVLQRFARFLLEHMRSEDMPARYGGEEFLLTMPQTGSEGAITVASRLLEAAREQKLHGTVDVRFSAGVATYPTNGHTASELIAAADRAMYEAKAGGKNAVCQARTDQRSHIRYSAEFDVLYSFDGTIMNTGVTRDVSRSGVRFDTDKRLEVGQPVTLIIRSSKHDTAYEVRSKIVWLNEIEEQNLYRFGAQYSQEVTDAAEALLSEVAAAP